jgi:hypothetical protein
MPRPRRVVADTVRRFVPARGWLASVAWSNRYVRFLLAEEYEALSYVVDWREAFEASPRLQTESCNVNDAIALRSTLGRVREFDLIVALHSATGDSLSRLESAVDALGRRRGKLLVLLGNEYSLMTQKLAFLRQSGAEFVGSQLPRASADWLYTGIPVRVLEAPAGLNPTLYRATLADRSVDIGFRGDRYQSSLIGDRERERIIEHFAESIPDGELTVDISYGRLPRASWSAFLARCRGTIGAEAGTYFLERDDATHAAVGRYLAQAPAATFDEIYERFWRPKAGAVSGKAISSRHFEAIGTRTCQILMEGSYNGILEAGRHYIPVRRDLSDVVEATRRFLDPVERGEIVESAYHHLMSSHTYGHRVEKLLDEIG